MNLKLKRTRTLWGTLTLFTLLLIVAIGWRPDLVLAQATTGYTKVNSTPITALTFTTAVLIDGAAYNFEVTAVNAAGESIPSNIFTVSIPSSGSHTVTLSWIAPVVDATHGAAATYNVYDQTVQIPNLPGALSGIVN